MNQEPDRIRLLVIPGLRDSGPAHWQTWLESSTCGAVRVQQRDWTSADLEEWAQRIALTISRHRGCVWVAAAHSFGCLALARYIELGGRGVAAALFVAPADPAKFDVGALLPSKPLGIPSALIASETDPWMSFEAAQEWARHWGSHLVNLGDAGHVNAESGYGPLPRAKALVQKLTQRVERGRRDQRLSFEAQPLLASGASSDV